MAEVWVKAEPGVPFGSPVTFPALALASPASRQLYIIVGPFWVLFWKPRGLPWAEKFVGNGGGVIMEGREVARSQECFRHGWGGCFPVTSSVCAINAKMHPNLLVGLAKLVQPRRIQVRFNPAASGTAKRPRLGAL